MVFQRTIKKEIKLTKSEKKVLEYIEYPILEIAEKLSLSHFTIRTHLTHLREKYNVHSRAELCTLYYRSIIEKQKADIQYLKRYNEELKAIIFNLKNNIGVCDG